MNAGVIKEGDYFIVYEIDPDDFDDHGMTLVHMSGEKMFVHHGSLLARRPFKYLKKADL